MNAVTAVSLLTDLVQAASHLMAQAQAVSNVIQRAQIEGRDITPEEWAAIDGEQMKARAAALLAVASLKKT
jgi:hypothetical protein